MKRIYILIAGLIIMQSAMAQNAYYDALILSKHVKASEDEPGKLDITPTKDNIAELGRVFRNYTEIDEQETEENINAAIGDFFRENANPFLAYATFVQSDDGLRNLDDSEESLSSKAMSAVSGFNVATIADGLAKFLVKRAKQELSMAFFEKFKKELDKHDELRIIFPKTHAMLNAIGEEIYNFSGYINMLREAFQLDLQNMIPNLRQLLDDDSLQAYLKTNQTVDFILRNALLIAEGLQNGTHPGDILTDVKDENMQNSSVRNLSPGLQLLDLFSQSVTSTKEDRYWISSDSLKLIFKNELTFKVYLGLIYQKGKNIKFQKKNSTDSVSFGDVLSDLNTNFSTHVVPLRAYMVQLVASAEKIDRNLRNIQKLERTEGTKSTYSDHYAFYISAVELIKHAPSILELPALAKDTHFDRAKFDKFIEIAYDIGGLYLDASEKNYFGAVMGLSTVLEKTIPRYRTDLQKAIDKMAVWTEEIKKIEGSELMSKLSNMISYAREQDQSDKIDKLVIALDSLKKYQISFERFIRENASNKDKIDSIKAVHQSLKNTAKQEVGSLKADAEVALAKLDDNLMDKYADLIQKLMKYGNLAASIAKAESSDEVEKIIESIALPAGSASIKKKSDMSVSLNAYVGLSPGEEFNGGTREWKFVFGVHTPIGVAINWGKELNKDAADKTQKDVSNSLFLSVIDITAFSSFRFDDSETSELPEVSLGNIFAPGLYYVHGMANMPVSWGIGGQLGPQLRTLDGASENSVTFSGKFFVAVDIPLINFYTKPR